MATTPTPFSITELQVIRENIGVKNNQELADLIHRPINDIQEVVTDIGREKPVKQILRQQKLLDQQNQAKERHALLPGPAKQVPIIKEKPVPIKKEKPVVIKEKKLPAKKERELKPVKEKTRTQQVKDARKLQRNLEEKRMVEKDRLQQRKVFKDKRPDYTTMKSVRIDSKTIIYINKNEDPQVAIKRYNANNCNDIMRMKIRDSKF